MELDEQKIISNFEKYVGSLSNISLKRKVVEDYKHLFWLPCVEQMYAYFENEHDAEYHDILNTLIIEKEVKLHTGTCHMKIYRATCFNEEDKTVFVIEII